MAEVTVHSVCARPRKGLASLCCLDDTLGRPKAQERLPWRGAEASSQQHGRAPSWNSPSAPVQPSDEPRAQRPLDHDSTREPNPANLARRRESLPRRAVGDSRATKVGLLSFSAVGHSGSVGQAGGGWLQRARVGDWRRRLRGGQLEDEWMVQMWRWSRVTSREVCPVRAELHGTSQQPRGVLFIIPHVQTKRLRFREAQGAPQGHEVHARQSQDLGGDRRSQSLWPRLPLAILLTQSPARPQTRKGL